MNKPFTLYCGYRTQPQNFLPSPQAMKIENVYKIAKPLSILSKAKNNNLYALIGENLEVLSLGMLKEEKTKENKTIYIGQKVFATDKKTLCGYYKEQAKLYVDQLETHKDRANCYIKGNPTSEYIRNYYMEKIYSYTNQIKKIQILYKQLVENIKQL